MFHNKKLVLILLIAITLILVFLMIYLLSIKPKNEIANTTLNENNLTSNTGTSKTDIVRKLFIDNVLSNDTNNADYKIDKITIVTDNLESLKSLYSESTSDDIFATVVYSIKPIDMNAGLAGNGEQQGDWVVNKSNCVYIQYNNGDYIVKNVGTGW